MKKRKKPRGKHHRKQLCAGCGLPAIGERRDRVKMLAEGEPVDGVEIVTVLPCCFDCSRIRWSFKWLSGVEEWDRIKTAMSSSTTASTVAVHPDG